MKPHLARIHTLLVLALMFFATGCDTFLGLDLKDDEYRAPDLSLYSPLQVIETGQEITVTVEATGGSDYFFGNHQQWFPAEYLTEQNWLSASFRNTATGGPASSFFFVTCDLTVGGDHNDFKSYTLSTRIIVYNDLMDAYREAIADAAVAEESELADSLLKIKEYQPYLDYQTWNNVRHVIVMAWVNEEAFGEQGYGEEMTTTEPIWVVLPHQVGAAVDWQRFTSTDQMKQRLTQYLGGSPETDKDSFVFMAVRESNLFRPTMDPEIDDSQAQLTWSEAADSSYRAWFEATQDYSDSGFPWTRMGYTYDWGNPDNEIGASEFVIREDATIYLLNTIPVEYFLQDYGWYYGYYYY